MGKKRDRLCGRHRRLGGPQGFPVERLKSCFTLGFLRPRPSFKEGGHWVWALLFGLTWEESLLCVIPCIKAIRTVAMIFYHEIKTVRVNLAQMYRKYSVKNHLTLRKHHCAYLLSSERLNTEDVQGFCVAQIVCRQLWNSNDEVFGFRRGKHIAIQLKISHEVEV